MNKRFKKTGKYHKLILFVFISFFATFSQAQGLKIYEVQSENYTTLLDEDGDASDWFEIINAGENTASLKNYGIADDEDPDSAWIFPDFVLDPGQIIVVFASGKNRKAGLQYWNSPVLKGDVLKYLVPQHEIAGWTSIGFDDSSWGNGPSGIGYGDTDDATVIANSNSLFVRAEFEIDNLDEILDVAFHMDYDDGFVAYLNGVEIARSLNMGNRYETPAYNAFAEYQHEAIIYQGENPEEFHFDNFENILVEGKNVLAIQVHNVNAGSSDLTAIPFFSVLLNRQPENLRRADFLPQPKNFHVHFRLDADEDSLFLFSPEKLIVDQAVINSPGPDLSVGYPGRDFSKLMAFTFPTPYIENYLQGIEIADSDTVIFLTEPGLYTGNVQVKLSSKNENSQIYYTTDGSVPTKYSNKYTAAFNLTEPTTVKARVVNNGALPGVICTASYYPNYKKTLPVSFISTDPAYLWDEQFGMYSTGLNAETEFPYYGANFWKDMERPAHVEMYFPGSLEKINIDGGIKIFGGWSRGHPQKSISVFARKSYGDKNIKAKLFDDREFNKFEALVYRNSGNDWFGGDWSAGTYYRDLVTTKLANENGVDVMAGRPTIMFLNGEYWGIQNLREKINEHFIASNHSEDSEKLDILEGNMNVIEGSNENYAGLIEFLENNNISDPEVYKQAKNRIDINEFINYNIFEIYCYNGDWPGNNLKFWRAQRPNGKWRWIMYDTDFGFAIWDMEKAYHETMYFITEENGPDWPNPPWATFLFRTLLKNKEFKNQFINTFADMLNTTLLPQHVKSVINERINEIDSEIPFHAEKWGWNYDGWLNNNENVKYFADVRPDVLWPHLTNFFELQGLQNLKINVQGTYNGRIKLNSIFPEYFPWEGNYFNNVPVKLTAIPPEGYRFVRWEGDINSSDISIELDIDRNKEITAVFETYQPGDTEGVIINEISYKALKSEDSEDWVELLNNSSQNIDISGWIIQDSEETHRYKIPDNTIMAPGDYLVVCRDMYEFSEVHPSVFNVIGPFDFGFSGYGECIYLYNKKGEIKDQVCYANEYPWPEEANGQGYTLSLSDPDKDNMLGFNWSNSSEMGGTPGLPNNGQVQGTGNSQINSGLTLLECYPNPFNTKINIPVKANINEHISIDIYNTSGQLLTNIFEGEMNSGFNSFTWDAKNQVSGIYLIRLQSNNCIQVKKVVRK